MFFSITLSHILLRLGLSLNLELAILARQQVPTIPSPPPAVQGLQKYTEHPLFTGSGVQTLVPMTVQQALLPTEPAPRIFYHEVLMSSVSHQYFKRSFFFSCLLQ